MIFSVRDSSTLAGLLQIDQLLPECDVGGWFRSQHAVGEGGDEQALQQALHGCTSAWPAGVTGAVAVRPARCFTSAIQLDTGLSSCVSAW